jgi:phospholipid/cholesterol/gamma-HCH transport system substrate-binding protein
MNERVIQFRVGVVVVAATIITGILIMLFGEGKTLVRSQYTIFLRFPLAPGVTVDTPVRKHGVTIGRVSTVELLDEGGVLLTARIDEGRRLYRNEVCLIRPASLLGDAVLDFVPSAQQEAPGPLIQDGDLLADGLVASNPLEVLTNLEENLEETIGSIGSAANEVELLARNLNSTLGGNNDQLQRILDKSERALDQFTVVMTSVDSLIGDEELRSRLRQTLADLPQLVTEMKTTIEAARQTMAGIDRVSGRAEQNLANIENFTRPLGERGEELVGNVAVAFENLEQLTGQLAVFGQALNNPDGSLGRFIQDRQLYDRLDEAVRNVNMASRRIRPILDDVRTFTDKIAQDPRQLGLAGALDRRPLGSGIK